MASEKQEINESQIALSPKQHNLMIANQKSTEIIVIDDDSDEETTLEPMNKKPRLGSWWDNVEPYDELSTVVRGLPKEKENNYVAPQVNSYYVWTSVEERKKKDDENRAKIKGYGHVTLEDLGVTVEDLKKIPWEAFDPMWSVAYEPWLGVGGYIDLRD